MSYKYHEIIKYVDYLYETVEKYDLHHLIDQKLICEVLSHEIPTQEDIEKLENLAKKLNSYSEIWHEAFYKHTNIKYNGIDYDNKFDVFVSLTITDKKYYNKHILPLFRKRKLENILEKP